MNGLFASFVACTSTCLIKTRSFWRTWHIWDLFPLIWCVVVTTPTSKEEEIVVIKRRGWFPWLHHQGRGYYQCVAWFASQKNYKSYFNNHAHFKFILHMVSKFLTHVFICWAIDDIIDIDLNNQQMRFTRFSEKWCFNLSSWKTFSFKKELNLSYQALGACLRPYRALVSLKIWLGFSLLMKPGVWWTWSFSFRNPLKKIHFLYPFEKV